ncbi:MoaD/ThiS family protein [Solirubrobacter ginsenosidimutans]|uniref:MoaD/ThiS family protein n=1 Tax=Solirubrobacter ginsenosidimutans TaxID=490573 RepID=A0A9X3MVB8_9ACTN|nr:MoaD/ThiS family protein [Solirubrobacter ginsenosidimutans]MDA0160568.1 MoaD/ThiS family protein [Solirubrobacter ginsenosidimutans]
MTIRVRLGAGLSAAPFKTVEVPEGATVDALFTRLADDEPDLASTLRSVLPIVAGEHVTRDHVLADGQEVALLIPISGG